MINASKRGHPIHLRSVVHQPPPGVPQVAHKVQNETNKTSNSDANKSNNNSVTSYYYSIASDVFLCSLLSSSSPPQPHEIARTSKELLINEVNIYYNHQFIINIVATEHMSGILKLLYRNQILPQKL